MVEVEEVDGSPFALCIPALHLVDGSLGGRGLGLWRPSSPALVPSGRRIWARDFLAGLWALGWAWWGGGVAPLQGEFSVVLGAPVGLVLGGDALDGVGAVKLQGVALWLIRGASALVELILAVPLHPDLHPTVWARVLEAELNRALTPDPVARVVVAEKLLDFRAFLELWARFGLGRSLWREGG